MAQAKRQPRFGSREEAVIGGLKDAIAHVQTGIQLSRVGDSHLSFQAALKRLDAARDALEALLKFTESTARPSE